MFLCIVLKKKNLFLPYCVQIQSIDFFPLARAVRVFVLHEKSCGRGKDLDNPGLFIPAEIAPDPQPLCYFFFWQYAVFSSLRSIFFCFPRRAIFVLYKRPTGSCGPNFRWGRERGTSDTTVVSYPPVAWRCLQYRRSADCGISRCLPVVVR